MARIDGLAKARRAPGFERGFSERCYIEGMASRTVLLIGATLCAVALLFALRGEEATSPATPVELDALAMTPREPMTDAQVGPELTEPSTAQGAMAPRVDGLSGKVVRGTNEPDPDIWTLRFECSVQDSVGPLPRRLDVVLEGPDVVVSGLARRKGKQKMFEVELPIPPEAIPHATLFAATTIRALLHRSRRPFRWYPRFDHYRLGQVALVSAEQKGEPRELILPKIRLRPPTMLGRVLRGGRLTEAKELMVWTRPDPSSMEVFQWSSGYGHLNVSFAAFVEGGTWGAGESLPEPGAEPLPYQDTVPVGSDVFLFHPTGVLELEVNLVTLPDARSILVRNASGVVPAALTASELDDRASGLGNGVTTLSDKVVGRGQLEHFPVGKTTLPSGDYAVEAWSVPNDAGLMYLVASKSVSLGVGTTKFTLR